MTDWEGFVREHRQDVWQTARRLLGDDADAADCFQETFVDFLELSRRQTVREPTALLRRIVTARALDRLRRRIRLRRREVPADAVCFPSSDPAPAERAQANELVEQLQVALAELPAEQALAFVMRFLGGASYKSIATAMGITTDAAGVLLHRARARLRERLKTQEVRR